MHDKGGCEGGCIHDSFNLKKEKRHRRTNQVLAQLPISDGYRFTQD